MANNWIPNYIRKNMDYQPHEVLTAKEFNAILNLLITQGDYNSSWLYYLQTEGIPDAVAELSIEEIQQAISVVVREELAALAASVVNKTSAHLNAPVFSFLNLSIQADMSEFRTLLENHNLVGDFCIATNLVGLSAAYPTLLTLQAMQVAGHEIVPVGVDGSSFESLTEEQITAIVASAAQYMATNLSATSVFVYPGGTSSADVQSGVASAYTYAVNSALPAADVDSESIRTGNLRLQLPIVYISSNHTIEDASIKAIIDDAIATNKHCIIAVDTSATEYSGTAAEAVITYLQSHAGIEYSSIEEAMEACETTINNQLRDLFDKISAEITARQALKTELQAEIVAKHDDITHDVLADCYIDNKDEHGVTQTDKYLHW